MSWVSAPKNSFMYSTFTIILEKLAFHQLYSQWILLTNSNINLIILQSVLDFINNFILNKSYAACLKCCLLAKNQDATLKFKFLFLSITSKIKKKLLEKCWFPIFSRLLELTVETLHESYVPMPLYLPTLGESKLVSWLITKKSLIRYQDLRSIKTVMFSALN